MRHINLFNAEQGLSLFEVLVAMLFLAAALVGFSAFMPYGRGAVSHASSDRLAVMFAEGQLEKMTAAGFNNVPVSNGIWSSVTIDTHGTTNAANYLIGQYKIDVSNSQITSQLKLVTVTLQYPINRTNGTINGTLQASQKKVVLGKFIGK